MAIKRTDRDGEIALLDSKDFGKFKEYATRFGLRDETTPALRKRKYVKHAKFYFGELGLSLPKYQEDELIQEGLLDVIRAYFSKNRLCNDAQHSLILRRNDRLIDDYLKIWDFDSDVAEYYSDCLAENIQKVAIA